MKHIYIYFLRERFIILEKLNLDNLEKRITGIKLYLY